jgi:hypothetical protein
MRLITGFYDMPENAHLPKPPPPDSVTISNLQSLRHLEDVDAYYRLALLSYRTKDLNQQVEAGLAATRAFLAAASEAQGEFVPATPEFVPADAAAPPAAPTSSAAAARGGAAPTDSSGSSVHGDGQQ